MFFKLIIFCAALDSILDPVFSCSSKAKYQGTYRKCTRQDCMEKSACVTIYEDSNWSGWQQCLSFGPNDCIKFNPWWVENGVKSVNSHETCIRLYDMDDCSGGAVEIKPNDINQRHLEKLKFYVIAKSASSCNRNIGKGQCYIKNIFYEEINAEKFSTASTNMLETMDKVAELVTSGSATVIPGIDVFYSGLQFVTEMLKQGDSTEDLIDQKITNALTESAASQVSAKIGVVEKKIKSVFSKESSLTLQQSEMTYALGNCEEVYKLFLDKNYSFRKNVLISSPHLVAFSSVYLAVAKIAYKLIPSKRTELVNDMIQLIELNKLFKEAAIEERQNMIKNEPVFDCTEFRCAPDFLMDRGFFGNEVKIRSCGFNGCSPCIEMIHASIEKEIELFFHEIIDKLEQFP